MNAGGVPYACKSYGRYGFGCNASGERVSNTYVTYPNVGDNSPKGGLIPHVVAGEKPVDKSRKARSEGRAAD